MKSNPPFTVEHFDANDSDTPFRREVWAVARGRRLIAWCMCEESARLLKLALNAQAGSEPERLRLMAEIAEGSPNA